MNELKTPQPQVEVSYCPKPDEKAAITESEVAPLEKFEKVKQMPFAFATNTGSLSAEALLESKNEIALNHLRMGIGQVIDGQIYSSAPSHGGIAQFFLDINRGVGLEITGEIDEVTKFNLEDIFSEIQALAKAGKIDEARAKLLTLIGEANCKLLDYGFSQTLGGLLIAGMQSFCHGYPLLGELSLGIVKANGSFFSDIIYEVSKHIFVLHLHFLNKRELQLKIVYEETLCLNKWKKFQAPLARSKCFYTATENGFHLDKCITNGSHFIMLKAGRWLDILKLLQIAVIHGDSPQKLELLKFLEILMELGIDIPGDELQKKIKDTRNIQELRELIENTCTQAARHFPVQIREWIAPRCAAIAKLFGIALSDDRAVNVWLNSLVAFYALQSFKGKTNDTSWVPCTSVELINFGSELIRKTLSPYICSDGSITFFNGDGGKGLKDFKNKIFLTVEGGKIACNHGEMLLQIVRDTPTISFAEKLLVNASLPLLQFEFRNVLLEYYKVLKGKLMLPDEGYYVEIGGLDMTEIVISNNKQVYLDFIFPIKIKTISDETQLVIDETRLRCEATMLGLQLRIVSKSDVFKENSLKDEEMDTILETLRLPELKDLKASKEKLCNFLRSSADWCSLTELLEAANTVAAMRHVFLILFFKNSSSSELPQKSCFNELKECLFILFKKELDRQMSDQAIVVTLQTLALAKKSDIQKTIKASPRKEQKSSVCPDSDSKMASSPVRMSSPSSSASFSSLRMFPSPREEKNKFNTNNPLTQPSSGMLNPISDSLPEIFKKSNCLGSSLINDIS
jgi:hypothetical protein